MLIGIGGATLAGKTTTTFKLCEELSESGFRVGIVPEFAETVAKEMGYSKIEDVRKNSIKYFQFELEILLRKIALEERLRGRCDIVICDTTPAEIILYSKQYLPQDLSRIIENIAKKYLNRYNIIFLLKPLNVKSDDNFRSKRDIAKRLKHHAILKTIYPRFIEIPVAPVEERLKLILTKINSIQREMDSETNNK